MKPSYLILLLAMNFCWAAVYASYKVIGEGVSPGGIVTLRFGLAGLVLLAAWPWAPGPAPRGKDLMITCLMGLLLFVVGQRLQVYGNQIGTAANSAVLMGLEPLVTSVAAALFLREHIGPRRVAGFALGVLGVATLHGIWRSDFRWTGVLPSLIFVSSFVFEAIYSVVGKPVISRSSPVKVLCLSLLVGTVLNLLIDGPTTLNAARGLRFEGWVLLFGLAIICTAVGYTVWFLVIRECPVNVAALTVFAQSVFGVFLAWSWLKEPVYWGQFLGSVIIIAGLVLGLSRQITPRASRRTSSQEISMPGP